MTEATLRADGEAARWRQPAPRTPHGRPNVLIVVLDDLGFGQLGCYGADIATPAIDALATGGLRYNRFHVTALCSPTRASLLTGRNHHAVGMGLLPDLPLVPHRGDLPVQQRQAFARMQEVFAGFLTHTDHQIGRILGFLADIGQLDNTVVVVLSDNGASAEGGRIGSTNEHRFGFSVEETIDEVLAGADQLGGFQSYNHYAWGWAWAGNAPFRLWKRYTWLGGTRVPLIVRGPAGLPDAGAVRDPPCHVVDLFPTVLELCGVDAPDLVDGVPQQPVDGSSLAASLRDPEVGSPRPTQYFEMLGSRSIYHGRWEATTDHVSTGVIDEDRHLEGSRAFEDDHWALFDLDEDFAEAVDVSAQNLDTVRDLQARWVREAERNGVMPLDDSLQGRIGSMARPRYRAPNPMRYLPGGSPVASEMVVSLAGGGRITASVHVPESGAEGVLCSMGDRFNGWALLVLDGRLTYLLSAVGHPRRLGADVPLRSGAQHLGFEYQPGPAAGEGEGRLLVDDRVVATSPLPATFSWANLQIGPNGLTVGRDRGFPVTDVYQPPFPWSGTLHHVEIAAEPVPEREVGDGLRSALHRE